MKQQFSSKRKKEEKDGKKEEKREEKERTWLQFLCLYVISGKNIVWIVSMNISHDFKF